MKKLLAILMSAAVLCGMLGVAAFAVGSVELYVTIADANGKLALARAAVTVTDADGDGALTIGDALYCAHESFYPGGASAGYKASETDFGLSLMRLWGAPDGESYGYYLNDTSAWSLLDTVSEGDFVYAFVYTDRKSWSDSYSFFDVKSVETTAFKSFELTLHSLTYDTTTWALVEVPVAGAVIEVNGERTSFITDENGRVSVTLTSSGSHVVSASSAEMIITPPVCVAQSATGGFFATLLYRINTAIADVRAFFMWIFSAIFLFQ